MNNSKPNAGTPYDWEEYEKFKEKKDGWTQRKSN
jgi:hypothetical protein